MSLSAIIQLCAEMASQFFYEHPTLCILGACGAFYFAGYKLLVFLAERSPLEEV